MNDDDVIAEIEERLSVRSMAAGRNHGHMSEMDAVEAHKDCAALLAIVKGRQSEIDALTDDISRALETITAENEARVAAEKREAALREALLAWKSADDYSELYRSIGTAEVQEQITSAWEDAVQKRDKALARGPA